MKLVIALAFVLSAPAFAAPTLTTCQLPELSGSIEVSFTAPDEVNKAGVTVTNLVIENTQVPMIRTSCFYKSVRGKSGFLCAHQDATVRYDLYPIFGTNEDGSKTASVVRVNVMKWAADGSLKAYATEDCR